ncbi:AAA family ATPase [Amycolatopsis sp. NPDC059021]|uniref:AAA family ATPase n=1 Tax=Amycolatopsis sp. NPDC059021 TaxID=3346704 RepID=UPI00366CB6B8
MNETPPAAAELLDDGLSRVDLASTDPDRLRRLEVLLADVADVAIDEVTAVQARQAGDLTRQLGITSSEVRVGLAVVIVDLNSLRDSIEDITLELRELIRRDELDPDPGLPEAGLLLSHDPTGWSASWLGYTVAVAEETASRLAEFFEIEAEEVSPARSPEDRLVVGDRIRRMLRLSVQSRSAVMLVGAPGTGKTQLLTELVTDVQRNPKEFGLSRLRHPMVVTPDESWTARELVGGETVDNEGKLKFSPGHVLEAIHRDRWLILDEANRADLDRIFAGLFTWLSGQSVEVGRINTDPQAGQVILGWSDTRHSRVIGHERLRGEDSTNGPVYYLAGTDWRLLGTYNAVDAQRVFRFGQALGRRFDHIPIPTPDVDAFSEALSSRLRNSSTAGEHEHLDTLRSILREIYIAHLEVEDSIGPAALLAIPKYVSAGLRDDADVPIAQLVAEAYLAGAGTWLGGLGPDQLAQLGARLSRDDVLGVTEWNWVQSQLKELQ